MIELDDPPAPDPAPPAALDEAGTNRSDRDARREALAALARGIGKEVFY